MAPEGQAETHTLGGHGGAEHGPLEPLAAVRIAGVGVEDRAESIELAELLIID